MSAYSLKGHKVLYVNNDNKVKPIKLSTPKNTQYSYGTAEKTGEHLSVEGTYNDTAGMVIGGKTVEVGEGDKSPDNPYELKSVGDNGGFDLVSAGENLLDSQGVISADRQNPFFSNLIPVGGKKDVVFQYFQVEGEGKTSNRIRVYDKDRNLIKLSGADNRPSPDVWSNYNNPGSSNYPDLGNIWGSYDSYPWGFRRIRVPARADIHYVELVLMPRVEDPITTYIDIKAEYGINPTPYTPFRGMQSIHMPYTLRSLPNGTRDYIEIDNVAKRAWLVQNITYEPFSGFNYSSWVWVGGYSGGEEAETAVFSLNGAASISNKAGGYSICTHTPTLYPSGGLAGVRNADYPCSTIVNLNRFYIRIPKTLLIGWDEDMTNTQKRDLFVQWYEEQELNGIQPAFMAELAEPIITELDYEEVKTFYPYTQMYSVGSEVQPLLEGKFRVVEG